MEPSRSAALASDFLASSRCAGDPVLEARKNAVKCRAAST